MVHARIHVNGLYWDLSDFECSYDVPQGKRLELHYDDDEVRYDGARFSDDGFPRFENPYVSCGRVPWEQYHYTISFAHSSLTHDFHELKTKVEGATVGRFVDWNEYDANRSSLWTIANRGAARAFRYINCRVPACPACPAFRNLSWHTKAPP